MGNWKRNVVRYVLPVMILAVFLFTLGIVAENDAAFAQAKMKWRMGGQNPLDHQGTEAINWVAEEIKKRTDGRIEITTYPASQLGDYTTLYEEVMRGTLEMNLGAAPAVIDDRLMLLIVPYLYTGWDEISTQMAPGGWVFETLKKINLDHNVILLGYNASGLGGLGSTKPILNITDPASKERGMLMRVPPHKAFQFMMDGLGFRTVSVPWAELYTALQTGVADGWVGGNPTYSWKAFGDILKYYYQMDLYLEGEQYTISKDVWDKLSPEDQKIVQEVVTERSLFSFGNAEKEDHYYMDKMKEAGWTVYEFTKEEKEAWAKFVRENVWKNFRGEVLPVELFDEMTKVFGIK